jgi:hypothetical protein
MKRIKALLRDYKAMLRGEGFSRVTTDDSVE